MAEDKWNVKGLRGSVLEELINYTNEKYRQQKLALVQTTVIKALATKEPDEAIQSPQPRPV